MHYFNASMNHCNQDLQNQVRFSQQYQDKKESSENVRKSTEADFSFTPKNQPKVFHSNFLSSNHDPNIIKS